MAPVGDRGRLADVTERVSALFERELQFAPPAADTDLFGTSALDSLSFVTLLAGLEQEFGLSIPLDELDLEHFASIGAIARFVAACQDHDDAGSVGASR